MATHAVNVLVKARDEASRKFGIIGASARVMGKAFKSVASITKRTLAVAFRVVKYAVMGLSAAFAYCTYAAIKQEAAEVELASALKMVGEYSEDTMQKLKAQAAAIQDVTIYGDEYILTLMRMAMTLGVTKDKAADAAKAAIALHAGFGGGRGKPEIFLRYYIDALRGTGSSLESYVGELRKAKTHEEKLIILNKAMTRGWEVVKSKADSAGGALKQMKNKLGDVAEAIAWPFLPSITTSAKAVTKWAKENEANIAYWAKKTRSYVTLIKDVFLDFVDFMREDWRAALGFVFDSFLKLLKATFESAVLLAIAGGKGIWRGVKEGLLGGTATKTRVEAMRRYEAAGGPIEEHVVAGGGMFTVVKHIADLKKFAKIQAQVEKEFLKEKTKSIMGETLNAVTDTFKDALKAISEDMPADLREQVNKTWAEHLQRLKELGKAPGRGIAGAPGETGVPTVFSMAKDMIKDMVKGMVSGMSQRKLAPFEARFLTSAPGRKFDYEQQTAQNTKEQNKLQRRSERQLNKIIRLLERTHYPGRRFDELAVSNLT